MTAVDPRRGRRYRRVLLLWIALASSMLAQQANQLPRIEGNSFAGQKVVLPDAISGKVAVLIFGFSKASGTASGAWARKISQTFSARPGFDCYQLPVLEDVPRLVRGMVISGIRNGIAPDARDHFVPVLQGEAALKQTLHFKNPDDAYLVVLDRSGKIVDQLHGPFDESRFSELSRELESLLK